MSTPLVFDELSVALGYCGLLGASEEKATQPAGPARPAPPAEPVKGGALASKIVAVGNALREAKASKKPAEDIKAMVADLMALKAEYKVETGEEYAAPGTTGKSNNRRKEKKAAAAAAEEAALKEAEARAAAAPPKPPVVRKHLGELPSLLGNSSFESAKALKHGHYYVTTAISYTNGPPHMGHAYEAVTADTLARWHRLWGRDVFFLTGTDEHGQKIQATAEANGLSPIEICNKYAEGFKILNRRMLVSNNRFIRTTDQDHIEACQELWRRCAANGDIYLTSYEGYYSVREERFITETEAAEMEYMDNGVPLTKTSEPCYNFRLSKYRQKLIELITANPDMVQPKERRFVILKQLEDEDMPDLSVSRTAFDWGIPMPEGFDKSHVMYVWFDALTNYIAGVNGLDQSPKNPLRHFWPADCHIIGKDIIRFHSIYWPAMLLSAGVPLPKTSFSHGFINAADGRKMSKSFGNVIDPHEMLDKYPIDAFRFYLCSEAVYGGDLKFSEESMMRMYRGILADTIGNFVHRATNLATKYAGGKVAAAPECYSTLEKPVDVAAVAAAMDECFKKFDISGAKEHAMVAARDCNNWLARIEPWKMKEDRADERSAVVRMTLEAVYVLALVLGPFLPVACTEMLARVGQAARPIAEIDTSFNNLDVGNTVVVGAPLFDKDLNEKGAEGKKGAKQQPKLSGGGGGGNKPKKGKGDEKKVKGGAAAAATSANEEAATCPFMKLDIRVGLITDVWHHPEAEKLFCEKIACGFPEPIEVCSGLRAHYTLEEMQNRRLFVICNLKSAKMQGFVSNGMVLCAKSEDGSVEFISPPADAKVGDRLVPQQFEGGSASHSPAQIKKKKVWEEVASALRTDGDCVATWNGIKLVVGGAECRSTSIANAPIS